jgi:hypothetical protein
MDFDGVDFLNNMSHEDIQANVETINTTKKKMEMCQEQKKWIKQRQYPYR